MSLAPLVSIVLPVFNDETTIAAALESCLAQTMSEIEVICVDDGSSDHTVEVIEQFAARDARVQLVRHERTMTAFEGRRTGVSAASAAHVLFLDGDDELTVDAAATAHTKADSANADLVGFGVTVIEQDGSTGNRYEQRLQPVHTHLEGGEVLRGLFPVGKPAQGQLWRYLFRTEVLREAYALLPDERELARVNDLPLMFVVAALSKRYVSISERLYRYHFGRGGSGHRVDTVERAVFYTSAIHSIDVISPAVEALALTQPDSSLLDSYKSARLAMIGYVCFQLIERSDSGVLDAALAHLHTMASAHDIIHATARFYPSALAVLSHHTPWLGGGERPVRSILLATSTLRTGGVSAVLTSQAHYLRAAGYRVTIVARSGGTDRAAIPAGVPFVELTVRGRVERLEAWAEICRAHEVDVVIDHQVLYTQFWPEFALMARAEGASTVGWVHNFVARPVFDGSDRLTLIERCSNTLAQLVVLSPLDVAYFKLRGVTHVSFAPNPPSPLLLESVSHPVQKSAPTDRIELVWWGRLEQRTKQVRELIAVGVELRRLEVDFRLTIIGPDWDDVTAAKLNAEARRHRVGDSVVAVGPLHGARLRTAIDAADAFVSTSIIEGYQLTIAEAQARGLPVLMYDLPWLTLVQGNDGVVSVAQGDARGLARAAADLINEPQRYARLSQASMDAAGRARDYDFSRLYRDIVEGTVPPDFSPEATREDASQLLGLMVFYAERSRLHGRTRLARESSVSRSVWERAAPIGKKILRQIPRLRPHAHRVKQWLRLQ